MNVGELISALSSYDDDMQVAILDPMDGKLDTFVCMEEAIHHPGSRLGSDNDWHWKTDTSPINTGTTVLVLY